MSDIRSYNIVKKKIVDNNQYSINEISNIINNDSYNLLGLTSICNNVYLDNETLLENLYYDEEYRLVVLEYRKDKYGLVVKKGLIASDYIRTNNGKVKVLLNNYLPKEIIANINLNPRVLVIGEDFNEYDYYSIKQVNLDIELIKMTISHEFLLIQKLYQTKKQVTSFDILKNEYAKEINDYILNLGDDILINYNGMISYRKLRLFAILYVSDCCNLLIDVKNKKELYPINNQKDLNKAFINLSKAYELS